MKAKACYYLASNIHQTYELARSDKFRLLPVAHVEAPFLDSCRHGRTPVRWSRRTSRPLCSMPVRSLQTESRCKLKVQRRHRTHHSAQATLVEGVDFI